MHEDEYRPRTWEGVVGQPTESIRRSIDGSRTPNFLFHGPPGTGKTSVAYLIADDLGAEVMNINGSDDRGIEYVREEIVPRTNQTTLSGRPRVVLLDEMEGMTLDAQQALRQPLEQSSSVFVLATNETDPGAGMDMPDLDGIHDALISRCVPYEFGPVEDRDVRERVGQLAEQEGVELTEGDVATVVGFANGDMRSAIMRYVQVARGAIERRRDGGSGGADTDGNAFEQQSRSFLQGDN